MKAIINGKILLENRMLDGIREKQALLFCEKIIGFCNTEDILKTADIIDAAGAYVSPGLIDLHSHGCLGEDATDGLTCGLEKMSEGILKNGVTAWLPTTMTVPVPQINKAFDAIRSVKEKSKCWDGAEILGVNMEGPYLNKARKGAHLEENLIKPDPDFIKKNSDIMKLVTIAPEIDENFAAIKAAVESGVAVSIGHSDADYETAMSSMINGVMNTTHLFNAMSPLNHRNPGVVGAALNSNVYVELIADTFHIHKALFNMVYKIKKDKLILISDSVRAAGLPDGEYELGGQKIILKGVECRLTDGTIAGSVLAMIDAVKNVYDNTDIPLHEIVACASLHPARLIGCDNLRGSVEIGKNADIIIFGDDFKIKKTIIKGVVKYGA